MTEAMSPLHIPYQLQERPLGLQQGARTWAQSGPLPVDRLLAGCLSCVWFDGTKPLFSITCNSS